MQPAGDAELFASGYFAFHVKLRSGIVSDEYSRKTGLDALSFETSDFAFEFGEDLIADFESVKDACGHAGLTFEEMKKQNNTEAVGRIPVEHSQKKSGPGMAGTASFNWICVNGLRVGRA